MSRVIQVISYPSSLPKFKTCIHLFAHLHIIKEVRKDARPIFDLDGFEGELLHLIADGLGISLEYYVEEAGWSASYPVIFNVSEIRGCIGMVARAEVDFTVSANILSYHKEKYAVPSYPYLYSSLRFMTKLPDYSQKPFAIVEPFTGSVWISILLILLFMSFVFYLIQGKRLSYPRQVLDRFSEIVFQSRFKTSPSYLFQERILFIFWIVGVHFLALCYIAVILKFMIAPTRQAPVDNNEKLLAAIQRGDYKLATPLEVRPFLQLMRRSINPTTRELADFVVKNKWELSMINGNITNHLRNNFAVVTTEHGFQVNNQLGFPVVISKDVIYNVDLVPYMSKTFKFKEKFDMVMLKIFEGGLYTKVRDHYIFRRQFNNSVHTFQVEAIKPLTLKDMESVFLLFSLGIILSIVVLLLEIINFKVFCKKAK